MTFNVEQLGTHWAMPGAWLQIGNMVAHRQQSRCVPRRFGCAFRLVPNDVEASVRVL